MQSEVKAAIDHYKLYHELPSLWEEEYLSLARLALTEVRRNRYILDKAQQLIEEAIYQATGDDCHYWAEEGSDQAKEQGFSHQGAATKHRWEKGLNDYHPLDLCEECWKKYVKEHPETEEEWF